MNDGADLGALWTRYKGSGSIEDRNRLVLHYSALVKYVAGRVAAGLPNSVDQADLVSYGMFGLIDAINRYQPERGFKFETYAISRIRGAIIDELRSIDWVPRSVRNKSRSVEKAYSAFQARHGRSPSDAELAEELEMSEAELAQLFSQVSMVGMVALEDTVSGADRSAMTVGETLADRGPGPGASFELEETRQMLAQAIEQLPDREKLVLALYYYEGFTLSQIGEVLKVTESRISQIHTKAVLHLRARLSDDRAATG